MRDKGIFIDITKTFAGGRFKNILEAGIVMSPAYQSELANSADKRRQQVASLTPRLSTAGW